MTAVVEGREMLSVRYIFGHFRVRRTRTGLTLLGIALVVGVFCYLLCFADGLRRALAQRGLAQSDRAGGTGDGGKQQRHHAR